MPNLLLPNYVGDYNKGFATGQTQRFNSLAGQAMGNPGDSQQLLAEAGQINPGAALQVQSALDRRQAAQAAQAKVQHDATMKRINGAVNYFLSNPNQDTYSAMLPVVQQATGKPLPQNFDPSQLPHIQRVALMTGGIQKPTQFTLAPGAERVDETGRVIAKAKPQQHLTYQKVPDGAGGFTLEAFDQNGQRVSTLGHQPHTAAAAGLQVPDWFTPDQKREAALIHAGLKPRASATNDNLLSDGGVSLADEAAMQGYKLPIPSLGRSAGARAQFVNHLADSFQKLNIPFDQAIANMRFGESGTNGAKQAVKQWMLTVSNESSAQNAADLVTQEAAKVTGRTNIPLLNKWILAGKKATGDPEVVRFNSAVNTFAEEYAKVMTGSTGGSASSDSARAMAHQRINSSQTPEQLAQNIAFLKEEMRQRSRGQLSGIQHTIVSLKNGVYQPTSNPGAPITNQQIHDVMSKYGNP